MTRQDIIDKLKSLGIQSTNVYPKKVFKHTKTGVSTVGLYEEEFKEDFYFTDGETKLYKLAKSDPDDYPKEIYQGKDKWQIPLDNAELIWEEKVEEPKKEEFKAPEEEPYRELEDEPLSRMTIRDFYCIIHDVPCSGKEWLNQLISPSSAD